MPPAPNVKTKQDIIASLANCIFEDMVSELQFDTVLRGRQDADKAKRRCKCCGTHCSLPHTPGASTSVSSSQGSANRNATSASAATSSSGSGTPTKDNGNVYLICPVCNQQFAHSRCALHLAKCMGGRRAKTKPIIEDRSSSPYVDLSDEFIQGSASQKAKPKKKDSSGNGKRPGSPSLLDTPPKKTKKQKVAPPNDQMEIASSTSSLRKNSTASSTIDAVSNTNLASPSPSRYSSPNTTTSADSGGSTMVGSQPKPSKPKKPQSSSAAAAARGPPGSSKGRSIAAARLMADTDSTKP